jgi:two-component system KDP operon response regulator KdpE
MARILVVEDDAIQLEMRKQILEHAGHEVVAARNASEALERWTGCPVVVMDLRIPEPEDGLRLIHAIGGAARIIVLSGGELDPTLPVDEFLTKPCPSRTLLAAIEKWKSSVT